MPLICQPIPHGDTGIPRQRLHIGMGETAVFYPVEHTPQHTRGVFYRLLFPQLGAVSPHKFGESPQIIGGSNKS